MRDALLRRGVRIFESTAVTEVRDEDRFRALTDLGSVDARFGIIAANGLSTTLAPAVGFALPIQIYSLATHPLDDAAAASVGRKEGESVLDVGETSPFTQRFMPDGRLWFGAGIICMPSAEALSRPAMTDDVAAAITAELVHRYPALSRDHIDFWWGGTLSRTVSDRPMIGKVPGSRSAYLAIACMGKGMALGSSAGLILTHLLAPDWMPADANLTAFLSYCKPRRTFGTALQRGAHQIGRIQWARGIANGIFKRSARKGLPE